MLQNDDPYFSRAEFGWGTGEMRGFFAALRMTSDKDEKRSG